MTIPTGGSIVDAMSDPATFGPWFAGASWDPWRTVLKGAFALPMTDAERDLFRILAERDPPQKRVRELWVVAGRRAGKDSIASLIAAHAAAYGDFAAHLRPGERATVMCLACDRDQARIVLRYTRGYFDQVPLLKGMIARDVADGFELINSAEVAVHTNTFRAVRGRGIACAILDECAFFADSESAAPDWETYRAILPGLATLPGSMLIGISSPYWQRGLLFDKFKRHFGQADDEVLVIRAPSILLNPTLDQSMIDQAIAEDPEAAAAEWLGTWRRDVSGYIDRDVADAAVVSGRIELPPVAGVSYHGFLDAAGGSGSDSMTIAIAHQDADGRAVLDLVRERRPPFSPAACVAEMAAAVRPYGVQQLTADRYAGDWPAERFHEHQIACRPSAKSKSDLYLEMLPLLNSGAVELLDNPRLIAQLVGLERRTARGGRDSVDHAPGGHDDIVNAAAGALVLAAARTDNRVVIVGPIIVDSSTPMTHSEWLAAHPFGRVAPVDFSHHSY